MKTQIQINEYIQQILSSNRFAVLATESQRQPYTSFIAITPINILSELVFATYWNTRKYDNLMHNNKVSVLFEYRNNKENSQPQITILTAYGKATEVVVADSKSILQAHLQQHPEMNDFLKSADCAIFQIKVEAYQLVLGIDEIYWLNLNL